MLYYRVYYVSEHCTVRCMLHPKGLTALFNRTSFLQRTIGPQNIMKIQSVLHARKELNFGWYMDPKGNKTCNQLADISLPSIPISVTAPQE